LAFTFAAWPFRLTKTSWQGMTSPAWRSCAPQELVEARLLVELLERGPGFGGRPEADRVEEVAEAVKVVLGPLVERVLVALGTFEPDAEEGVAEADDPLLGLPEVIPGPEVGQRLAVGVHLGLARLVRGGHEPGEVVVALALGAAGRQDQAGGDLVIRHVLGHPLVHPVVPLARDLVAELLGVEQLGRVAREVAKLGRPPRGVARASQELVDLEGSLLGRGVGQERLDLNGRR
jgi:hypothetical protein